MSNTIEEMQSQLEQLKSALKIEQKTIELVQLQKQSTAPDFWTDDIQAKEVMQKISHYQEDIQTVEKMRLRLDSLADLAELLEIGADKSIKQEFESELMRTQKDFEKLKTAAYLSDVYDTEPAILSINAGQGGTEAMDWSSMLLRMYMRFCEREHYSYRLIEQTTGEEAGIKSATLIIKGKYAYGYLKGETGTHRLVRLSPFNADNLRQTSFAGVEVIPMLPASTTQVKIPDEELEWQFYKSGGAGGQNVNKVNTAVRVKHLPTDIVVSSQSERTQIGNRKVALDILQAKLEQRARAEQKAKQAQLKGEYKIAGWGNQIRSYVLHPYQMVKDLRTECETSDTSAVLDGDLAEFIQAEIAWLADQS